MKKFTAITASLSFQGISYRDKPLRQLIKCLVVKIVWELFSGINADRTFKIQTNENRLTLDTEIL